MKQEIKDRTRGCRDRGITASAKSLGVSRVTLWRVINGKTENPELLAKYRALISMKNTTSNPNKL